MTCASCAARIEKKLTKLDGVSATVNYATEKAGVATADTDDPGAPGGEHALARITGPTAG